MNEKNKESILLKFQEKIHPSIEKILTFIDESSLIPREKNSLSRINSSFQSAIKEVENAISNNHSDDITQIISNIDNEFMRFYKRLSYFLGKEQDNPEIPDIISQAKSSVQESINFLSQTINKTTFEQEQDQKNDNNNDKISEKQERKKIKRIDQSSSQENESTAVHSIIHENKKDIKNSDLEKNIPEIANKEHINDIKSKNMIEENLDDLKSNFVNNSQNISVKSKNDNKDKIYDANSKDINVEQNNNTSQIITNKEHTEGTNDKKKLNNNNNDSNDHIKSKETDKKDIENTKYKNIDKLQRTDTKSQNINKEQINPIESKSTNKEKLFNENTINDTKSKDISKESPSNIKSKKGQSQENNQDFKQEQTKNKSSKNKPENEINQELIDELKTKSKTELLNLIRSLTNEIESCNLRSNILEKKLSDLTQKSLYWTESHINEPCDDPDTALFDILLEQQDTLNDRIKKITNLNDEIRLQIDEENAEMNKKIRDFKNCEEEINKEINEFINSNVQTRLTKANLDKKYFDMKMEINEIEKSLKFEQNQTENSHNRFLEMVEQVSFAETSSKDLKSKVDFYNDKCSEIEDEIQLMKSRKITSQKEILFQKMQDAEIDLLKTRKEYETLVNSTVPDLKYKLNKISEEISHLASLNRKEQEEAEPFHLQYIKDQIYNIFHF